MFALFGRSLARRLLTSDTRYRTRSFQEAVDKIRASMKTLVPCRWGTVARTTERAIVCVANHGPKPASLSVSDRDRGRLDSEEDPLRAPSENHG